MKRIKSHFFIENHSLFSSYSKAPVTKEKGAGPIIFSQVVVPFSLHSNVVEEGEDARAEEKLKKNIFILCHSDLSF